MVEQCKIAVVAMLFSLHPTPYFSRTVTMRLLFICVAIFAVAIALPSLRSSKAFVQINVSSNLAQVFSLFEPVISQILAHEQLFVCH
jgi:hypothetical protein